MEPRHPIRQDPTGSAVPSRPALHVSSATVPPRPRSSGRLRVLAVVGTRPETIKMFSPIRALHARGDLFETLLCSTGQHDELLRDALETFGLAVDADLAWMRHDQQPSDVAWAVGRWISDLCRQVRPDVVLVQGDTTTAMAAGLGAFYGGVRLAHIEAGLRTYDNGAPWPEEANRRIIGAIADLHFAPSELAAANLLREGVSPERIHVTGNTGTDALHWALARTRTAMPAGDSAARTVLVTCHRRESIPDGVEAIISAVRALARRYPGVRFLFVAHPAPAIQHAVAQGLNGDRPANVEVIPPCDYLTIVELLAGCHLVLTDSGGLQEEAPVLGKPVLVVNDRTARQEPVRAGTAQIVGTTQDAIVAATARLLDDPDYHARMATCHLPYGDGHAGERIAAVLGALARLPARQDSVARERAVL